MYIIQMNKTTQYLFIITICIFIFIIYKFLWKRDMITRIINKLQRRFLKCKDKCKNVDCNCNTLEGMELFGTIEGEFNNLTKSDATKIVSIPSEYTKRPLKDYVIKSSYNSAITGKYANIDMVKYLLHRGVRFLDFEIMLIDNAPMITYSYDKNGNMHCLLEEVKSKRKHELNLKPSTSKDLKELRENLDFEIEFPINHFNVTSNIKKWQI